MTTLNDKDVEAIFYIRKARAALRKLDGQTVWADDMLTASRLVGASRVEELGQQPYCRFSVEPVECEECGDYGIHIDDTDRWLCPKLKIWENDDALRCDQCGEVPGAIGEGEGSPICGRCFAPMWTT